MCCSLKAVTKEVRKIIDLEFHNKINTDLQKELFINQFCQLYSHKLCLIKAALLRKLFGINHYVVFRLLKRPFEGNTTI